VILAHPAFLLPETNYLFRSQRLYAAKNIFREVIIMTIINTIGRITRDFEMRKSDGGCTYANFSIAVNEGFGDKQKTTYYECTAFDRVAERLVKAKAKKGSQLQVVGLFGTTEFDRNNGEKGYSLKITVLEWKYVSGSNGNGANGGNGTNGNGNGAQAQSQAPAEYPSEGDYSGITNLDDEDFPI
jgi:single-strand DNA-binding protein